MRGIQALKQLGEELAETSSYAVVFQWRIQTRCLGISQTGGRQKCLHLLKYQRLSATFVGCHTKVVAFCRPKSDYYCWSNYAITTV